MNNEVLNLSFIDVTDDLCLILRLSQTRPLQPLCFMFCSCKLGLKPLIDYWNNQQLLQYLSTLLIFQKNRASVFCWSLRISKPVGQIWHGECYYQLLRVKWTVVSHRFVLFWPTDSSVAQKWSMTSFRVEFPSIWVTNASSSFFKNQNQSVTLWIKMMDSLSLLDLDLFWTLKSKIQSFTVYLCLI